MLMDLELYFPPKQTYMPLIMSEARLCVSFIWDQLGRRGGGGGAGSFWQDLETGKLRANISHTITQAWAREEEELARDLNSTSALECSA